MSATYGILAVGHAAAIVRGGARVGFGVARYLELDTAALADEDRALLGLLTPALSCRRGFARLMADARAVRCWPPQAPRYGDPRVGAAAARGVSSVVGRTANVRDLADDAVQARSGSRGARVRLPCTLPSCTPSRPDTCLWRVTLTLAGLSTQVVRDAWEQGDRFDSHCDEVLGPDADARAGYAIRRRRSGRSARTTATSLRPTGSTAPRRSRAPRARPSSRHRPFALGSEADAESGRLLRPRDRPPRAHLRGPPVAAPLGRRPPFRTTSD